MTSSDSSKSVLSIKTPYLFQNSISNCEDFEKKNDIDVLPGDVRVSKIYLLNLMLNSGRNRSSLESTDSSSADYPHSNCGTESCRETVDDQSFSSHDESPSSDFDSKAENEKLISRNYNEFIKNLCVFGLSSGKIKKPNLASNSKITEVYQESISDVDTFTLKINNGDNKHNVTDVSNNIEDTLLQKPNRLVRKSRLPPKMSDGVERIDLMNMISSQINSKKNIKPSSIATKSENLDRHLDSTKIESEDKINATSSKDCINTFEQESVDCMKKSILKNICVFNENLNFDNFEVSSGINPVDNGFENSNSSLVNKMIMKNSNSSPIVNTKNRVTRVMSSNQNSHPLFTNSHEHLPDHRSSDPLVVDNDNTSEVNSNCLGFENDNVSHTSEMTIVKSNNSSMKGPENNVSNVIPYNENNSEITNEIKCGLNVERANENRNLLFENVDEDNKYKVFGKNIESYSGSMQQSCMQMEDMGNKIPIYRLYRILMTGIVQLPSEDIVTNHEKMSGVLHESILCVLEDSNICLPNQLQAFMWPIVACGHSVISIGELVTINTEMTIFKKHNPPLSRVSGANEVPISSRVWVASSTFRQLKTLKKNRKKFK